jgi:hypothetical protein
LQRPLGPLVHASLFAYAFDPHRRFGAGGVGANLAPNPGLKFVRRLP